MQKSSFNYVLFSNPIAVTEFVRHVEKMSADSNLLFSQEYEVLCTLFDNY